MIASAQVWAREQFGQVQLGDRRLQRRAVAMGQRMAERPAGSLPTQMQTPAMLRGAYWLLNHPGVSLETLTAPHRQATLAAAGRAAVALLVEDTTELDFTAHVGTGGLGPIGDGAGRGLLLHSTLAVLPASRQVLGLAQAQVVLRRPTDKGHKYARSPEGQVWCHSARQVGRAPAGSTWVHVSDAGSDMYEYLGQCRALGKHFLVRAQHNRQLLPAGLSGDYARQLPAVPGSAYLVPVPRHGRRPARQATVVLAWAAVTLAPPEQAPPEVRDVGPLTVWLLRVWEPAPPAEQQPLEWLLLSSLPITDLAQAQERVAWYTCRWLCEDYHQCLKTGCRIEHTQLDDGADICRLLGFASLLAVRLLQLRQAARHQPQRLAQAVVDPLMVRLLAQLQGLDPATLTTGEFWRQVARLGGHQGRRGDGPPGWCTLWRGWRYLADLTRGAHLFADSRPPGK